MSRVNSGEKILNNMEHAGLITASGKAWVISAIDPFHDKELPELCGFPDSQVGQSIVMKVPTQMTINRPSTVPADANWKFLLTTYPWTYGSAGNSCKAWARTGNFLQQVTVDGTWQQPIWPVCVYAAPDDPAHTLGPFATDGVAPFPPENPCVITGLKLPEQLNRGPLRIIGWGMELINTTAVTARQGTLTAWRQNTSTNNHQAFQSSVIGSVDPTQIGEKSVFTGTLLKRPPNSVEEANALMNTRTWAAEEGLYSVIVMNDEANIAKMPATNQPVIVNNDSASGYYELEPGPPSNYVIAPTMMPNKDGLGVPFTNAQWGPQVAWNFQPYHMSGCICTGLSAATTFTLRVIWYVERFPSPSEQDLVYLTKPSAHHDERALSIYNDALANMPVGVPVAENPLGEWFFDGVKSILPALAGAAGPFGPLVSALGGAGVSLYENYRDSEKKKAKKQNNNKNNKPRQQQPNPQAVIRRPNVPQAQKKLTNRPRRKLTKKEKQTLAALDAVIAARK